MDDILKNWTRLSLTEDEGERVYLENDPVEDEKKFVLAARFLTCRVLNVGLLEKLLNHCGKHGMVSKFVMLETILCSLFLRGRVMLNGF